MELVKKWPTCTYQEVKNVSLSGNFAYVPNESSSI